MTNRSVGKSRTSALHDVEQELDVLLDREPADRGDYAAGRARCRARAERRAVAAGELVEVDAGRQHRGWRRDAVAAQHVRHLLGRHDQMVDLAAQLARQRARATKRSIPAGHHGR